MSDIKPEIFYHVGLGKIASTYLQYKFFPKLKGITYLQRTKYRRYIELVGKQKHDRYLLSREFDRQFETELRNFAKHYPDTHIIILLRRQDSWIASQYRRQVKNGYTQSFEEFVDIENNKGWFELEHIYFYPKLQLIKELFTKKPLVMFHDELKEDALSFFKRIAEYVGATFNENNINLKPKHTSYNKKQLLVVKRFSKRFGIRGKRYIKMNPYIRYRSRWLLLHLVLYIAKILPQSWVRDEELHSAEYMQQIREFYSEDWQKCLDYAANLKKT
jgi:hypothetical protein